MSPGNVAHCIRGLIVGAAVLTSAMTIADDETAAEENDSKPPKNWTEDVERSARQFDVYADADAETPAMKIAAYKWSNPARPRVAGDRLCLLYIHQGRPIASCKVYPTGQSFIHAFVSFTDLPVVAKRNDAVVWSPPDSKPTFAKFADTMQPKASVAGRRAQMKTLARKFSAETGSGEAKRQSSVPELRMLPQPLYRYDITDTGQDGVIDGAVFCFVANGGNPQVLLLIETVRERDSLHWQYGLSRRTIAQLKVFLEEELVWITEFVRDRELTSTSSFFKVDLPAD